MRLTLTPPPTSLGAYDVTVHDTDDGDDGGGGDSADGQLIGHLRFRVCHRCRTGRILQIWVSEDHQRRGLGGHVLRYALEWGPGYRWSTTLQSRQGRAFFRAVAGRTGVALRSGRPACPHLRGPLSRAVTRLTGGRAVPRACGRWLRRLPLRLLRLLRRRGAHTTVGRAEQRR
ncbi:GNAT family N-acetyltransferase [Streptomyces sp. G45]|uniref:GNAT family N-acetyltransferase n=1 Tax=Streptomyces sp. G45 TaxID=3406627 RepID=UPI003C181F77